ncbi:hypothetical protein DE171_003390 [Clostridium beijerinckii]|nr:hypothetical protein [Clostridium beijerinckii]
MVKSIDIVEMLNYCLDLQPCSIIFKLENGSIKLYNYENSYPKFLNDFSDEAIHFDKATIDMYKENIESFIDKIEIGDRIANLLLESLYLASIYVNGKI